MQDITTQLTRPPRTLYEKLIANKRGNSVFTILIFFLLAFSLSRLTVYLYYGGLRLPYPFLNFFGTHIHHFVFGIFLITMVGFLSLTLPHRILQFWRLKLSAVFGFGLGWIIDEFGMWLHLADNYYLRASYDAIIVTTVILINFVYFQKIWRAIFYHIFRNFN